MKLFSKFKVHYIWLIVIIFLDLVSVICSFVFYGESDKDRSSSLASAIIMTVVLGGHFIIACYFRFFADHEVLCKCDGSDTCNSKTTCVLYYGLASILIGTLGFLQIVAGVLISDAAFRNEDLKDFAGATAMIDALDAAVSVFFICFMHVPVIFCKLHK